MLFKRKEAYVTPDPTEARWYMIVTLVKDLRTKSDYNNLIEIMGMVYNAYKMTGKLKTPEQDIDEAGGFMAHEKEGMIR